MILKQHPSHDYAEMNVPDLMSFAENVVKQLGDNVVTFPSPDEPLVDITAAVGVLRGKHNAFIANPKLHAAELKAKRALIKLLNNNNRYVDKISDGDGGTIDLSGYHKTSAETVTTHKPPTPSLSDHYPVGKSHYYSHCKAQPGNNFIFLVCSLDAVVTKIGDQILVKGGTCCYFSSTHPEADLINLPSGDQYLRMATFNRAGMSELSAPVLISVP
jgi:hypothetical protein